jgi:hypothetical protein
VIWYIEDYPRYRKEREVLDTLASSADWLIPIGWRLDGALHVIWEADIVTLAGLRPLSLRYPNHFPHSPPLVLPRGIEERWSGHQYGAGGELCLEYGPDNWHPDLTGADMVASAHRLLAGEQPSAGQTAEVASRHATTLGQDLRAQRSRFLITRALTKFFETIAERTLLNAKAFLIFHDHSFINLISSVSSSEGELWRETLPAPFTLEYERDIAVGRWPLTAPWPSVQSLQDFRAEASGYGFDLPDVKYFVLVRGTTFRAFSLDSDNDRVTETSIIPPEPEARRLDSDHEALAARKVAIIGCGSLGSKIAVMLARAGGGSFLLVDDDLLMPDNLVRNDLDWRDVGTHKADSVASRIQLVNPAATCKVKKLRLGGQESSGSVESLIESLSECDLLIDATAEPSVFNYLCAAIAVGKKPLLWAEVFGGGFGGLIARHRPGLEPSPQAMRSIIENWCADRGQPIARPLRRYGGGHELPAIADDADVTVIAAHAARMAIDVLIPRDPSSFPNSVYLVGLTKAWLFSQPFDTYPIDVGPPESPTLPADDDPELAIEKAATILKLFVEYKNATSPSEPVD